MERNERYEINSEGKLVIGIPETLTHSEKKYIIEQMFSINGWKYTLLEEFTSSHYCIKLDNDNLNVSRIFHLYHGNIRKEDPDRNREEKKIQLGSDNDPRIYKENSLILGFYVYEHRHDLKDVVVVAWPIEEGKNYPGNPSLRVNMRTDIQMAKNTGYYVDRVTGKNLVAFRPEFIYYYIENYKDLHYNTQDSLPAVDIQDKCTLEHTNILLYGVPGCGKSHKVEEEYESKITTEKNKIRVVFHPDYTYSDFVGQLLPVLKEVENAQGVKEEKLQYEFVPGPFTKIIKTAYEEPNQQCLLIIEELNRGNAPAIFGEIFQLLDRNDNGESKYGIYNADIAKYAYGGLPENQGIAINVIANTPIKLPPNLTIVATMNTSDQNVFTMDTAFQRRWQMKHIPNRFTGESLDEKTINHVAKHLPNSEISWGAFAQTVNKKMHTANLGFGGTEDKSLGVYFATDNDLDDAERFAEKVLKYLWDDAFKLGRKELFNDCSQGLSAVIEAYEDAKGDPLKKVLVPEVYNEMQKKMAEMAAEQAKTAEEKTSEEEAAESAAEDNPAQKPAGEE